MKLEEYRDVQVPDEIIIIDDNRTNLALMHGVFFRFYPAPIDDSLCEDLPAFQDRFEKFRKWKNRTLLLILDGNFPLNYGDWPTEGAYVRVLEEVNTAVKSVLWKQVVILPYSADPRTDIAGNPHVIDNPYIHVLTGGKPLFLQEALQELRRIESIPWFYR